MTTETPPPSHSPPFDPAAVRPVIAGLMLAMFLSALEQTIVAPALAAIGRSLNDIENLSWVVTAYLLAATVATPLFGKLSDIYGRRAMMLIAVVIFLIGSLACALAPSMGVLVAARALQGFGGGGILPLAQTVIADILTPRERPIFQSYSSVMFMAASIRPLAGGFSPIICIGRSSSDQPAAGVVALAMTDRALKRIPRNDRPHKLDGRRGVDGGGGGAAARLSGAACASLGLGEIRRCCRLGVLGRFGWWLTPRPSRSSRSRWCTSR
jgi:MFS family permease